MQHVLRVIPHVEGIAYQVADGASRVITVRFAGRRVWSFQEEPGDVPADLTGAFADGAQVRFREWPAVIRDRLVGRTDVGLVAEATEPGQPPEPEVAAPFASADGCGEPVEITDLHGRHLVLNKWGRLGRALADAPPGMVDRMLDSLDQVRELVQGELGDRVYVTGGTLLGPVREGRLLPHDDDADLAYLSRHEHPLDVTLEAFELGRVLAAAGLRVLRLSAGHLQVVVDHDGVPDHYVDVFTGFLLEGVWHQTFPVRAPAAVEELLPPVQVDVVGRTEPAPRDPERMLVELFGPGWRVPDPAYTFDLPAPTADRFYGWFADYNAEREDWDEEVLAGPPATAPPAGLSAFGAWVERRTPAGDAVLDLGCGTGDDAWAWAATGRAVEALDYSRHAVAVAARRSPAAERAPALRVLNLLDLRAVVRLGAELAHRTDRWTVVGRRLLNAVEDRGRDNVWRLCSMLLRPAGSAHFDLVQGAAHPGLPEYRRLDLEQVVAEAAGHRLELVEAVEVLEPVRWFGTAGEHLTPLWRTTFRRRTR
jgi:SAM-dependent methyltransferase